MKYIISDIHGCFDQYQKLLEKINFSSEDKLYVLGDAADRGPESIKEEWPYCNRLCMCGRGTAGSILCRN